MKGWFLDNGDIELEDGTIVHDPVPVSMPIFGNNAEIPIGFTVKHVSAVETIATDALNGNK